MSVSVLMFDGLMCETEGLVPMLNEMTAAEGVATDSVMERWDRDQGT